MLDVDVPDSTLRFFHSPAMKRIPQPTIDLRCARWNAMISGRVAAALAGVIVTFCGARHLTSVDTVDGSTAGNSVGQGFSSGGLQYASQLAPPAPPKLEDPARKPRRSTAGPNNRQCDASGVEIRVMSARTRLSDLNK